MPSRVNRTAVLLPALGWSARDVFVFALGVCAVIAILVNTLLMQAGPHPAPMFKPKPIAAKPVTGTEASAPPPAAPAAAPAKAVDAAPLAPPAQSKAAATPAPAKPSARTPGEIITDIQRELARRGFFEGPVDGIYGPRTDGAIRDFEHTAGLKPSAEPGEALLQAIVRAPARNARPASSAAPTARPPAPVPVRNEIERAQPSKRVLALQRVLADYGYGQIKPTGHVDAETQAAIEKFERERKLPVTGKPSDRVARELAAVTGRALE